MNEETMRAAQSKRRPHVLGLTGNMGSGKSSVAAVFTALGVPCIDADQVARTIHQDPQHPATRAIAAAFPQVSNAGQLVRGSLRNFFSLDQAANDQLKRLLKPFVVAEIEAWTRAQTAPWVVWESAMLIDENIATDRVLVVETSLPPRMARLQQRNPEWTDAQRERVFALQLAAGALRAGADDLIINDGSEAELARQVRQLHAMYCKNWS
jgi:dephospho-CoA kinase